MLKMVLNNSELVSLVSVKVKVQDLAATKWRPFQRSMGPKSLQTIKNTKACVTFKNHKHLDYTFKLLGTFSLNWQEKKKNFFVCVWWLLF